MQNYRYPAPPNPYGTNGTNGTGNSWLNCLQINICKGSAQKWKKFKGNGQCSMLLVYLPIKSARTDKAPMQSPPNAAAVGMYLKDCKNYWWFIIKSKVEDMWDNVRWFIQNSSQGVSHNLFTNMKLGVTAFFFGINIRESYKNNKDNAQRPCNNMIICTKLEIFILFSGSYSQIKLTHFSAKH